MKAKELRQKNNDELQKKLMDLYRQQFKLRMQKGMSEMPQVHLFKSIRREIARIKTLLREKA